MESVLEKDGGKERGGRQHQRERTQKGWEVGEARGAGRGMDAGCNSDSYRREAGDVCVRRMCADG